MHESHCTYPELVAVVGGGRWARVLLNVLLDMLPPETGLSIHSLHNAESIADWLSRRDHTRRVSLKPGWPEAVPGKCSAVIVVNAARDHEAAVAAALEKGLPVLVEKPIALTAAAAENLLRLAEGRRGALAAAHVFLFARYLENFSQRVRAAGPLRCLRVRWTDPCQDQRYGENKRYDPGLPVFTDWLPHVLPILDNLVPGQRHQCTGLKFLRGGAHLVLDLNVGEIPCAVELIRNADGRERIFEAVLEDDSVLRLDFSTEPGTIYQGATQDTGDLGWEIEPRPVRRMLTAFLEGSAGGRFDTRLDPRIGLASCRVIDQVARIYRAELIGWLGEKLKFATAVPDADLNYAFGELLQHQGPIAEDVLVARIGELVQVSAEEIDSGWLDRISGKSKDH